jgi:hypothetical protein
MVTASERNTSVVFAVAMGSIMGPNSAPWVARMKRAQRFASGSVLKENIVPSIQGPPRIELQECTRRLADALDSAKYLLQRLLPKEIKL